MLYAVHFVLGLAWWYLVLLGTGPMTSAASFQTITNPIIRSAYSWILPGDILKNIIGIPLWVTFWPIELIAVIITNTFC